MLKVYVLTIVFATTLSSGSIAVGVAAENANHFELSDEAANHRLIYDRSNLVGNPTLNYNGKTYGSKKELRHVMTKDLGEVISITLRPGRHGDPTTLSLFVPRVFVDQGGTSEVQTEAVTIFHKSKTTDDLKDQRDIYTSISLKGTASNVQSVR